MASRGWDQTLRHIGVLPAGGAKFDPYTRTLPLKRTGGWVDKFIAEGGYLHPPKSPMTRVEDHRGGGKGPQQGVRNPLTTPLFT
eukprot:768287-Hanusia_phi.AAC.9